MPRNATINFYNPAGLVDLDERQLSAGAALIVPFADIDNAGSTMVGGPNAGPITGDVDNPYDPTPVPSFHIATPADNNKDLWLALSVTAPFGLANEYDEDSFVRYDSVETDLATYDIQPSVAYRINDQWSIGGGVDFQYADAKLSQAVDLGAGDGIAEFDGDALSVGWNAGVMYKPNTRTRLGAHYRSAISHDLELDYTLTGPTGAVLASDPSASADLDLPDIANLSAAFDVDDQWTVMGHVMWFGWNNFEDITATSSGGATLTSVPQNYQNTMAYALGAEYQHNDQMTFRGGVQYDETPTQDGFRTTRTPDGDRIWASVGGTYNINPALSMDLALTYIDVAGERIDVSRTQPTGGTANIVADAKQRIGIAAVGLNFKF